MFHFDLCKPYAVDHFDLGNLVYIHMRQFRLQLGTHDQHRSEFWHMDQLNGHHLDKISVIGGNLYIFTFNPIENYFELVHDFHWTFALLQLPLRQRAHFREPSVYAR